MFIPDFRFVSVPPDWSFDEVLARMDETDTRFLLVDREMLQNRPVLGSIVVERPGEGLAAVPGSRHVLPYKVDQGTPIRWILFERTTVNGGRDL
jgi:hypothetical protein